jgi:hypothetical protein
MSPVTKSSVTARLILALFDPLEDNPRLRRPRDVGEDTPQNRAFARRVIGHYNRLTAQRDDIWLCLGVFRVETSMKAGRAFDPKSRDGSLVSSLSFNRLQRG